MFEAVANGVVCVPREIYAVHRLQEEMIEVEVLVLLRFTTLLGIHEFEFVPGTESEFRTGLRADTYPVKTLGSRLRAVGLDGNRETDEVECRHRFSVELEQRLAARANEKRVNTRLRRLWQRSGYRSSKVVRSAEAGSPRPVRSDKVSVAEAADRTSTVLL